MTKKTHNNKKETKIFLSALLTASLFFTVATLVLAAKKPNLLESVNVQGAGKFTKIIIQSAEKLRYKDLQKKDGIYIYMTESVLSKRPSIQKTYGKKLVDEIRYGYKGAKSPSGKPIPLDYIFIKLKEPALHKIKQKDWVLVVELQPKSLRMMPNPEEEIDSGDEFVPELSSKKKKIKAVLPSDPVLRDFIHVGIDNHVPLQLAKEDYQLARLREFEAGRALFPSLVGRWEKSKGTLIKDPEDPNDDVLFERREVGLQIGQPIFQSGKLYYSLKQARMQKRISAQNVKKTQIQLTFDIIKTYHNLIKSQKSLKVRQSLSERSEKILKLTRKKRQLDLITQSEALNVESQYSQSYYRLLSDEKDLEIQKLKMESLLNISNALPESIPDPGAFNTKNILEMNTPVESLIDWAYKHRPGMISSEYTAKMQVYAEKAAKADGRLRIDASGFVGRAGGAFEDPDNPLRLRSSWNFGLQASTNFLGNSIKGNGSRDHSTPDFGETTATDTSARSASVGLLDSLRAVVDRRQAKIQRAKAVNDRESTKRNIEVEVREAYYNIQKAKIQIEGAEQELEYRRKELKIARQKERMNLIDPSQSMSAETSYADAVNNFEEAIAFYKTSKASLEKAVGTPLDAIPHLK